MAERPVNYLDLWYRKSGHKEIEDSFNGSKNSISIKFGENLVVSFSTTNEIPEHAQIETMDLEKGEKVPTQLGSVIALLQTSLDIDPDNHLNPILKRLVLNQIRAAQKSLEEEGASLQLLGFRVNMYEGRDREISQGHP